MMNLYPEYRKVLVGLVNSIEAEIGLEEENAVLILHKLDSVEKISEFGKWLKSRLDGEKLMATETEICRAAVQISKKLS